MAMTTALQGYDMIDSEHTASGDFDCVLPRFTRFALALRAPGVRVGPRTRAILSRSGVDGLVEEVAIHLSVAIAHADLEAYVDVAVRGIDNVDRIEHVSSDYNGCWDFAAGRFVTFTMGNRVIFPMTVFCSAAGTLVLLGMDADGKINVEEVGTLDDVKDVVTRLTQLMLAVVRTWDRN